MGSNNENTQECSLKIDTIWSEADESLLIKEEIVSDFEPDCVNSGQEDAVNQAQHQTDAELDEEGNWNNISGTQSVPSWEPLKKKLKNKSPPLEETKVVVKYKMSCMHDTKNFKIVKRRLRCGDCRSLVCPECCKVMIPNLQSHFLGSGICNSGTYLCKLCNIIFHSLCALQAHIRIHTMDTPYVCPDCGLIYNNIYFLILHLLNKCYHVYKIVRYKCKQCPGIYFTPENFVQHIQEVHIHCVFRCLYCSSLFNNYDEFNSHMENSHQKQKVQYLNYFRCSLCSNMVIPRFMYEKHITQHRENSEFYEVDYQCLCGETYNLIGAFRSHFSHCNKKGVLPPKWSFLQKKLRIQDSFQSKDIVIQTLPSTHQKEPEFKKITLSRSDNTVTLDEENGEVPGKCNKDEEATRNVNPETEKDLLCHKEKEKVEDKSNTSIEKCSGNSVPTSSNKLIGDGGGQEEIETSEESTPRNVQSRDPAVSNSDQIQNDKDKEPEQSEGDISNIYEHIPCDHLGYVIKTNCLEQTKKTNEGDDIIVEKLTGSFSPDNYKFVTELDEKTGFITTKTVPLEVMDDDKDENSNEDAEVLNFSVTAKQYCGDKTKSKGTSSLSCPFCIVLFPKHNLTFQQFRLHLESYHPDAALNITVSNDGDATPATVKTPDENSKVESKINEVSAESTINFSKLVLEENPRNQDPKEHSSTRFRKYGQEERTESEKEAGKPHTRFSDFDDRSTEECSMDPVNLDMDSTTSKSKCIKRKETSALGDGCGEGFDDCIENNYNRGDSEETAEKLSSGGKVSPKTISDLDYEGETSKDSNWSEVSGRDTRGNTPESKAEEKERSRRESEVWSEFYESLMLAEKLKKRKNSSPDSDGKKKSVVTDYSSKRVVKKPKRYRESSESADSNEYSDSDEDFLLENDLAENVYTEEKSEDQPNKKQILLDKLENFDGNFVNYLYDLVTRKEKLFELYKKHSNLRANRYSHDLRSYRKKVLNGIKQRGRPLKMLRYQELMKKKELGDEKNGKDSYQLKKKSEFSPENKALEKKRGRPRKYQEAAKLKERRRSDKEVDFIEKNFERDENDLSPSKRKRKLSTKLQYYRKMSDEKEDFSSGQVITNKTPDSSRKFTCAVCKETFPGLTEFRVHILVHRMEENTYQCMECGECFVVRPSLEKHLHAFHKIKNTDKYITDNECCSIKKEVVEEDSEPLKENQCKVCKDQFERAIDLTKHFRIHGMAFLKEFRKEGKPSEKRTA